jgi:hypothetical protein
MEMGVKRGDLGGGSHEHLGAEGAKWDRWEMWWTLVGFLSFLSGQNPNNLSLRRVARENTGGLAESSLQINEYFFKSMSISLISYRTYLY